MVITEMLNKLLIAIIYGFWVLVVKILTELTTPTM